MRFTILEANLKALEARIANIEEKLGLSKPIEEFDAFTPSTSNNEPKSASPSVPKNTSKSGNWLAIIAVICFVLAAGFIIKLSIETGWLTPERQVGIAALLGVTLIGIGVRLINTYRGYASYLPATGTIILYLTVFSAQRFYALLSIDMALLFTVFISICCIWLYLKFKHDIFVLTAVIGTYISPLIMGLPLTNLFSIYFFLYCSLTFGLVSIWVQSRAVVALAAYLAILINAIIGLDLNNDSLISGVLAIHFLIFSGSVYAYTRYHQRQLSEREAWSFFPVLMLFYAVEYYFLDRLYPELAPWISLLFATILIGLYFSAKKWFSQGEMNSQPMLISFISIVCFHTIYLEILPPDLKAWLLVIILISYAVIPTKVFNKTNRIIYIVPSLLLGIIIIVQFCHILSNLIYTTDNYWLFVSTGVFISICFLFYQKYNEISQEKEQHSILLGAAHLLAISGLYQIADPYGSFAVSACWLLYAILIMGFAHFKKEKVLAQSALFVLAFAAGKALLYDAASTPTLVRIFCLLLTGIVLYGAGFLMKQITEWE